MFKTWIHVLSVGNLVGEDTSRRRKEPTCSQAWRTNHDWWYTGDSKLSVPWYLVLELPDHNPNHNRSG